MPLLGAQAPRALCSAGSRAAASSRAPGARRRPAAAAALMASRHGSTSHPGSSSSQPTSPQLSKLNWRNPTVLLSQATTAAGTGARRFYLQLPTWNRGGSLHAHGSDSIEMDEEERVAVLGRAPTGPPPAAWQLVVGAGEGGQPRQAVYYLQRRPMDTALLA
ncbi:hypothetical protein ABPG75_005694 [Micractinium tetrahymenae]